MGNISSDCSSFDSDDDYHHHYCQESDDGFDDDRHYQKKPKKSTTLVDPSSSSSMPTTEPIIPPWLDLPIPITERILERLPLPDYIRFPAVCPQWRSIQVDHRQRHSAHPPPLPWLIVLPKDRSHHDPRDDPVRFYSPFERRFYDHHLPALTLRTLHDSLASYRGSLLISDFDNNAPYGAPVFTPYFLNVVTGLKTHLPPFRLRPVLNQWDIFPAVSEGAVCGRFEDKLCLHRLRDSDWIEIPPPNPYIVHSVIYSVYCGGKFYCYCRNNELLVVDPDPAVPTVELVEMGFVGSPLRPVEKIEYDDYDADAPFGGCRNWKRYLVECNGEVLLINEEVSYDFYAKRFTVFRADLGNRMWVLAKSIGDWVLLINKSYWCCYSMRASDIKVKGSCIYLCGESGYTAEEYKRAHWRVFEIGRRRVSRGFLPDMESESDFSQSAVCWVVPTL